MALLFWIKFANDRKGLSKKIRIAPFVYQEIINRLEITQECYEMRQALVYTIINI